MYKSNEQNDTNMETTMNLAIETYSNLSGKSFDQIVNDFLSGNEIVIEIITKLMFSVSSK